MMCRVRPVCLVGVRILSAIAKRRTLLNRTIVRYRNSSPFSVGTYLFNRAFSTAPRTRGRTKKKAQPVEPDEKSDELTGEPSGIEPKEDPSQNVETRERLTPAMDQWLKLKQQYPKYMLIFQVGDFYEMFYDDAVKASNLLGLTLTSRDKSSQVPMCGFPLSALDAYIEKLIKRGVMLAICDQMESPKEAQRRRSIIKREVTRLVTPGTLLEERFLHPRQHNYLAAIARLPRGTAERSPPLLGLAWTDLSTGEFVVSTSSTPALATDLSRLSPSELLLTEDLANDPELSDVFRDYTVTILPIAAFDTQSAPATLRASDTPGFSPNEIAAGAALLRYIEETQKKKVSDIELSRPSRFAADSAMTIDPSTRRALELSRALSTGERAGSLLAVIDKTATAAGARRLASDLAAPLVNVSEINDRLDAVGYFISMHDAAVEGRVGKRFEEIRSILKSTFDMERCLQRLQLGRGGPRDVVAIASTLAELENVKKVIVSTATTGLPRLVQRCLDDLGTHQSLAAEISQVFVDSPPLSIKDGNFIAQGYSAKLDELRTLRDNARRHIDALQEKYRKGTDIASLKIRRSDTLGYFVEIDSAHERKLVSAVSIGAASAGDSTTTIGHFIHCQTTPKTMRYKTVELSTLEDRINRSAAEAIALEHELFTKVVMRLLGHAAVIRMAAAALAYIDVASSLALLAKENRWCRPVVNDSRNLVVRKGRHPIVELARLASGAHFTENDLELREGDSQIALVTGPNMGGKSTYLRQNALIAILAQMGSYVPAKSAEIGLVDAVFSRIGASDDLRNDRSTFMVEMDETARIITMATPRSLVIMDEVGRGTSTLDGVAIATAVVEHLHNRNGCRTLFATHYRELTTLPLSRMKCLAMAVEEAAGGIVFLHRVIPGIGSRAYGIHVARLAGVPSAVTNRAEDVLKALEGNTSQLTTARGVQQLIDAIRYANIESLNLGEAKELLRSLQRILRENGFL